MSSKLFPFWWLNPVVTCAVVKGCLEGDYSTYTQKWVSDAITGALGGLVGGSINGDKVMVRLSESILILDLTDGTIISQNNTEVTVSEEASAVKSVLGKYFVCGQDYDEPFQIFKDGEVLQSVEVASSYWYGFIISADGNYIIAWNYNDDKLYCYEGS